MITILSASVAGASPSCLDAMLFWSLLAIPLIPYSLCFEHLPFNATMNHGCKGLSQKYNCVRTVAGNGAPPIYYVCCSAWIAVQKYKGLQFGMVDGPMMVVLLQPIWSVHLGWSTMSSFIAAGHDNKNLFAAVVKGASHKAAISMISSQNWAHQEILESLNLISGFCKHWLWTQEAFSSYSWCFTYSEFLFDTLRIEEGWYVDDFGISSHVSTLNSRHFRGVWGAPIPLIDVLPPFLMLLHLFWNIPPPPLFIAQFRHVSFLHYTKHSPQKWNCISHPPEWTHVYIIYLHTYCNSLPWLSPKMDNLGSSSLISYRTVVGPPSRALIEKHLWIVTVLRKLL